MVLLSLQKEPPVSSQHKAAFQKDGKGDFNVGVLMQKLKINQEEFTIEIK